MSQKNQIPAELETFLTPARPDPLETFRPLYEGVPPNYLVSLNQWKAFYPLFNNYALSQTNRELPTLEIYGQYNSSVFNAHGVTEAELKEAGFPENKPIYLNMRLKDGDKNRSIPLGLFIRLFLKQPEAAWLNFTSDLLPQ